MAAVVAGFVASGDKYSGLPTVPLLVVSELVGQSQTPASQIVGSQLQTSNHYMGHHCCSVLI